MVTSIRKVVCDLKNCCVSMQVVEGGQRSGKSAVYRESVSQRIILSKNSVFYVLENMFLLINA